jgi:hypothetical protein
MAKKPKHPYKFYVKGSDKVVQVTASSYTQALNKALSKAPGKFLETKYAHMMNLVTATSKAKLASTKSAHKQYVVLTENKDYDVETQFGLTSAMKIYDAYYKGQKLSEEDFKKELERVKQYIQQIKSKTQTPEVMKKAVKKVEDKVKAPKLSPEEMKKVKAEEARRAKELESVKPAKKAAKKAAPTKAEKAAPAKVDKSAKKPEPAKVGGKKLKVPEGAKLVTLSTNEMLAKIEKGYRFWTEEGKHKAASILQARGDKDAKHKMYEFQEK